MEGQLRDAGQAAEPGQPLGYVAPSVIYLDDAALDAGIPNVARIYDYLLGGKDNFAADREAALALKTAIPDAERAARDNRAFLRRAVRFLAEQGISQFIDIGTGLPTQGNVHEIARAVIPDARVLYVDNDLVVVSHARAILAKSEDVVAVEGDLCYPRELLSRREVRNVIDFEQPVGVLLIAVLHFIDSSQQPWQAVEAILQRVPPGSYLVVSHVTGDDISEAAVKQAREIYYGARVQGEARSYAAISRFFAGTELVEPGLVDVSTWRSGREHASKYRPTLFYAGVGRKPAAATPFVSS